MSFIIFGQAISTIQVLTGLVILLMFAVLVLVMRGRGRSEDDMLEAEHNMATLLRAQAEMQGRLATMAEVFGARQAELNQAIGQRLDGMSQRVTATIGEQTRSTHENLRRLQERLAVIDTAQTNIQSLAKDVVGLQAILSNKQTRGAFGQARMETIVADGLPMGAYSFQPTLSNGSRPDCTVRMPNGSPP
ncbi:DNA recombination protein RmuC, partial [Nostoc sp. 3335mG]